MKVITFLFLLLFGFHPIIKAGLTVHTFAKGVSCNGKSTGEVIALANIDSVQFVWSTGLIIEPDNNMGDTIKELAAGTYYVTVTSSDTSEIDTVSVMQANALLVNLTSNGPTCIPYSGMASAKVTGGTPPYQYLWTDGTTDTFDTHLSSGDNSITITDAYSCTTTSSIKLYPPDTPTVSIIRTNPKCYGEANGTMVAVADSGTPPYNYLWSNGNTAINMDTLSGTPSRETVTVTDVNYCKATNSATLTVPAKLVINYPATIVNTKCINDSTGSIEISVSGGIRDYTYIWSNGQTTDKGDTSILTKLAAGSYVFTVTDSNQCSLVSPLSIYVDGPPQPLAFQEPYTVSYDTTATVTLYLTGGTMPYRYKWSNGSTNNPQVFTQNGTFSYTVTDDSNCAESGSVNIVLESIQHISPAVINLYPNPVTDQLNISFDKLPVNSAQLSIIDAAGKELYNCECKDVSSIITVSTRLWAMGIYIVKLKTENRSFSREVLVQH